MAAMNTAEAPSLAAASSSSTTCLIPRSDYKVFLVFGEDTSKSFADHLFHSLNRRGIHTFRGDEKDDKGKPNSLNRLKAIEESRFAIVIFSREYPASTEHLDDLVKIVEEMKLDRVFPVFCGVEPSEVRKQNVTFRETLLKEFENNMGKVNKWREVLTGICNRGGWDLKHRHQTEVIEEITKVISDLLILTASSSNNDLVGIESRTAELLPHLDIDKSEGVRVIGIWGMPGVGKTTLAQEVFENIRNRFEASCFIENVSSEEKGLVRLQKSVCNFLINEKPKIQNEREGTKILADRLCSRKVLIILDDVRKSEQIKSLTGNCKLGPGSRIIVTTTNSHLLTEFGGNTYEVPKLNQDEALQLLCKKAFQKDYPPEEYTEVCNNVVEYASRLALALAVLGSFLTGRSVSEWLGTLASLKECPPDDILSRLKVCIDGLEYSQRETFLDIACFFKGEHLYRVKKILESCDHRSPDIDIEVLSEKSLITLRRRDRLWMHDLLQEVGWEIVRRDFDKPSKPLKKLHKRSRLWLSEDIISVLTGKKDTEAVEGLFLSMPQQKSVNLNDDPFPRMSSLRLLKIYNVYFCECPRYLCNKLRLLEWHGYPLEFLPSDFQPDKLVELNMPSGCIEQLWEESNMVFEKLAFINLSDCKYLTKTPSFNMVPNLEKLNLEGCKTLSEVHPSIKALRSLVLLNLKGCESLKSLPEDISLESLEIFILSGCSELSKFPEIVGNMTKLSRLHLDGTSITELPESIEFLTGLAFLDLEDCKKLLRLPRAICSLTSLKTLYLSGCSHLEELPENLGSLENLQVLDASETAIRKVPSSIVLLKKLKILSLHGCKGVMPTSQESIFPQPIGLQLPISFSGLVSLISLNLSSCNLPQGAIPDDIGCLSSLQSLDLSENNFTSLPGSINQLSELRTLRLVSCKKLQSLPKPPRVNHIDARDCAMLRNNQNRITLWPTDRGYCHIDCRRLDEENDNRISRNSRGIQDQLSLNPAEAFSMYQKKYEDETYRQDSWQFNFKGRGNSDWCSHSRIGSRVTIPLSSQDLDSNIWMGIGLFVLLYIGPTQVSFRWEEEELACRFETQEGEGLFEASLVRPFIMDSNGGFYGLIKFIPRKRFERDSKKSTRIIASVSSKNPKVEVKMCGGHVIYKQDVAEFIRKALQPFFPVTDWRSEHLKETRDDMVELKLPIDEINSAVLGCIRIDAEKYNKRAQQHSLRDQQTKPLFIRTDEPRDDYHFLPLLSRLFEGSRARNSMFACIFPVKAILPRFTFQCVGNLLTYSLPPDILTDSTWIGFSLYVVFTWHPSASPSDLGSVVEPPFLFINFGIPGCNKTNGAGFPLKKDNLIGLHRLVIFHVPRVGFSEQLNQYLGSEALFIRTNIPEEVEIEMCGLNLVYEKDLEEFVQIVTECTLQSPDIYHQRYYEMFEGMRDGIYKTGERFMEEGVPPIDLGYFGSLQSILEPLNKQATEQTSTSERDINEYLIRKYYQGFVLESRYNSCFPPSEIPEWFKYRCSSGPSVRIQLDSNLCDEGGSWIGLALWASFSAIEYQTTTAVDNRDSDVPHYLVCNLETDRGIIEPLHFYQTTNEEVKWLHLGGFIWLCYIPWRIFSHQLDQCSFLEASFGSDSPGLCAQECGLHPISEKDDDEFEKIILHCMEVFWNNKDLIPDSSSTTGTSPSDLTPTFTWLSIVAETSLYGIHSVIEWKRNLEKLLQHFFKFTLLVLLKLQGETISTFRGFDPLLEYNLCFPRREILEWFTSQSHTSNVKMQLPQRNLHDDSNMPAGFVICAAFQVLEHPAVIVENFGEENYVDLCCLFEMQDQYCIRPSPILRIKKEKFRWFYLHGFIWITYIPCHKLQDLFNEVTYVEATFHTDCPSLRISKCGIRLLYQQEVEEFKQTIIQCVTSFFDDLDPIRQFIADKNGTGNPFVGTQHQRSREPTYHRETTETDKSFEINPRHSERIRLSIQGESSGAKSQHKYHDNIIELQSFFPDTDRTSRHLKQTREDMEELKRSFDEINSALLGCVRIKRAQQHSFRDQPTLPLVIRTDEEPNVQMRRDDYHFLPLLSRMFEGSRARNSMFACIFPVKAILPRFPLQFVGNRVTYSFPPNILKDSTWIGLGLYVVFTWHPFASPNDLGSEDVPPFLFINFGIPGCDKTNSVRFPLKKDNLTGLHRLVIFLVPRVRFSEQLNHDMGSEAWFITTNIPDEVEIEMFGLNLVYEKDLEEFIRTVNECTLQSPDIYHQRYYQMFEGMQDGTGERFMEKGVPPIDLGYFGSLQSILEPLNKQATEQTSTFERDSSSTTGTSPSDLTPTFFMLSIVAETPLYGSHSVIEWKGNLEKLLQHFFKCNLVVLLELQGEAISTFPGFDPMFEYNLCFPRREILEWFTSPSHTSNVKMQLPQQDHDDSNMLAGFVMCAAFQVLEHPAVIVENFGEENYVDLCCLFETQDQYCIRPSPIMRIKKDKFRWFYLRGFIWITYIPCNRLQDLFNKVTYVEATFHTDCPSLRISKCGIRLLYQQEVEEFKQTIIQCVASFFDDLDPIRQFIADKNGTGNPFVGTQNERSREPTYHSETTEADKSFQINPRHSERIRLSVQGESRGAKSHHKHLDDSIELQNFNRNDVYSSCFPHIEILEWFSHHTSDPSVKIQQLPPHLENDDSWIGLGLCAYFSNVDDQSSTPSIDNSPHHLICQFETDRSSMEQVHIHPTTNEELKFLSHEGKFLWLSYIPREWFSNQLNQCKSLEASFVSDKGNLLVTKCGCRLIYEHDEGSFRQTIRQCMNLSEDHDLLLGGDENQSKQHNVGESESSTSGSSTKVDFDQQEGKQGPSDLKDKGKRAME